MMTNFIRPYFLMAGIIFLMPACSMTKLEARLEANPQCKDVVNPKTGALMPCPGSEKAFYKELGLTPVKQTFAANSPPASSPAAVGESTQAQASLNSTTSAAKGLPSATPSQSDCKPQIHKKTGGTLPCPTPD